MDRTSMIGVSKMAHNVYSATSGFVQNLDTYGSSAIQPYSGGSSTVKGNTKNLDKRLVETLESALSGVDLKATVVNGYKPSLGRGGHTGRHQGFAADIRLYKDDVILNLRVAKGLKIIQDFTQAFIDECSSNGYTPGIGISNSVSSYMGPTVFHYDIARTLETGSRVNLGNETNMWYGESWVAAMLDGVKCGSSTGRMTGPSGAVSLNTLLEYSSGKTAD